MSRKLLMNNYSENGLSPVMDGLICWLDGRDGRNGDTVWKDRSGNGNDFEVTNCQWGETSLKTHTTSSYFNLEKLLINRNDDFCLDIYFKQSINQVGKLRVINANSESAWGNGSSIFIENDNKIFYYESIVFNKIVEFGSINYISILRLNNEITIYFNGVKYKTNRNANHSINVLGNGNWNNSIMLGDYYSIRLYSKSLTEEEIQQNYLYEQSIKRGE